jgi:hypothetical protein
MIRKQLIKNCYRRLRAEFGVMRRTLYHTNAMRRFLIASWQRRYSVNEPPLTEVFGSEHLVGTLLDRLTYHAHFMEMNLDS